jgi:two-component system, cell cycle response regulator
MQPIEGKILILDDDPGFTRLLTDILQEEGYKVAALNSAKDVLYLARQFQPDLLVLDIIMPEMEGYAVCEFFKRDPELKFTRVIVLTGKDTVDCRVRSYKAGTDAFMTKPVELEEFREVVRTHLAAKLALDQMVGSLKDQGIYDLVTNCYTWRYIERRLTEELKRLERHKRVLSVLLVQLDHFSNIPLRYGFNFGNEILKTVSEAIAKKIRESDLVGRFGEDSFFILLPETPKAGVKAVATRIQELISSLIFIRKKRVAVRANLAKLEIAGTSSVDEVIKNLEGQLKRLEARRVSRRNSFSSSDQLSS